MLARNCGLRLGGLTLVLAAAALLAAAAPAAGRGAIAASGGPALPAPLPPDLPAGTGDGSAETPWPPARAPQIVGGSVASPGAWPWAVYAEIARAADPFPEATCTGSLIGARWVLTAAHCVAEPDGSVPADRVVFLAAGESDLTRLSDEVAYMSDVFYVGTWSSLVSRANDLALLRLDRPAPYQAVQLATPDDEELSLPGTLAAIVGWGDTAEEGPPSEVLREAAVPLVDDATCAAIYGPHFDPSAMLCAGYPEGGVDTCFGDSGGPLMVVNGFGDWLQLGITSFGAGCARPGFPTVYARVPSYTETIVATLAADPVAPVGPPAATTGRAATVKRTSARLGGVVRPNGLATSFFVELGPTKRYGRFAHLYAGAGYDPIPVLGAFAGLKPGTTYHYRVSAWSAAGLVPGSDRTFRTRR